MAQFAILIFLICAFRCFFILLRQLSWLFSKAPPPQALTPLFLKQACQRYASHREKWRTLENVLQNFPTKNYFLLKISNFAYFYLDRGPDHIKSYLRQGRRWESDLTVYMKKYVKKNSNIVDIGAHIGIHTIYLAQLLEGKGTVWAFEPQQKLFCELNANLAANRVKKVRTFRYALGEKCGSIEMNPRIATNEGATSIGQGGDQAALVTLDSLKLKQVSFMKIDVEGYEDRVLRGAIRTIRENKPVILIEIMCSLDRDRPEVKDRLREMTAFFQALDYNKPKQVSFSDYLVLPCKEN